ncbi:MAG: neutral zinc metallopeptidase [Burkholderiales bacterium]|jgi:predicted metalloprotease|nr:neutral zinc metallopeptidase [Burkholderiales bacterium]
MRWKGRQGSSNVEDRRGQSSRLGGGNLLLRGKMGIVILLAVIIAGYYGIDLTPLLSDGGMVATTSNEPYTPTVEEEEMARFTSVTLKLTEEAWDHIFLTRMGQKYSPPKLIMYNGVTQTTCGYGQSAMGPFYCPADQSVYIDLSFYQDMKNKLGGGGDFAQGYVIAHEVGHHIQNLLGINQKVRQMQARASQSEANQLSVKTELQADCFAGVWGHAMQQEGILESGDIESALRTAQAIGDDRLQKQSTGRVVPDSFTHGSSEQRYQWFKRGFDSGDPTVCDTFSASSI